MERHHEVAFAEALDQLYLEGAISVPWARLYLWFNAKRLGKNAYREIIRRWEEVCATRGYDDPPEIMMLRSDASATLKLQRRAFPGEEEVVALANWA